MRFYKALNTEVLHNKEFTMNSIILELDNKCMLVSSDFHHKRKYALKVYVWLPNEKKWVYTYAKNELTEKMWDYHRQTQKRNKKKYNGNYANMMKHSRKKKTGGSGLSRENIRAITDYECSKNPLYDFRMCYN